MVTNKNIIGQPPADITKTKPNDFCMCMYAKGKEPVYGSTP